MRQAWKILYAESASESEIARSLADLDEQTATLTDYFSALPEKKDEVKPDPAEEAMASLCQILYSSNRFLYIE